MITDDEIKNNGFTRSGVRNRFLSTTNENYSIDVLENQSIVVSKYGMVAYCGEVENVQFFQELIKNLRLDIE